MPAMRLYTFFRSSAAYRVRIGLNLKGITADLLPVNLRKGEQHDAGFVKTSPQHFVPALVDGPTVLTQSLAILEYLDETHPTPPFLPADPAGRARVRTIAFAIACDIHPLNNLRVLKHLQTAYDLDEPARDAWSRRWIEDGFAAIETMLAEGPAGAFCHGDTPTLADICLVPQIANAHRVKTDLSPYPIIRRIDETCRALPAFAAAAPENQPDVQ
jgi:maleylpyruvate isomerase